jgi:hypothetical protein
MMRPLWPSAQTLKLNTCAAVIGGLVLGIALFFCPGVVRAQTPVATATLTFEDLGPSPGGAYLPASYGGTFTVTYPFIP